MRLKHSVGPLRGGFERHVIGAYGLADALEGERADLLQCNVTI